MNKEILKICHEAIIEAVEIAGGQTALARLCDNRFKQQQVYNWLYRQKKVSPKFVIDVEQGIKPLKKDAPDRFRLRPDIYPED